MKSRLKRSRAHFLRDLQQKFAISEGSVVHITRRVGRAIRQALHRLIPGRALSTEALQTARSYFESRLGIPVAVYADGSRFFVELRDMALYDYQGRPSVQVFGVAIPYGGLPLFAAVFACAPGSTDEAAGFEACGVNGIVRDWKSRGFLRDWKSRGFLTIYDRGRPVREWSPRPFDNREMDTHEKRTFNFQTSKLKVIEHAWGHTKGRFRGVREAVDVQSFAEAQTMITAALLLHNLLVLRGDTLSLDDDMDVAVRRVRDEGQPGQPGAFAASRLRAAPPSPCPGRRCRPHRPAGACRRPCTSTVARPARPCRPAAIAAAAPPSVWW
eukprot:TRINITY_DN2338_c0_g1_i1.p1 TRINITY_DN2338_c0_g1~~TRINITY_DN2338_c0_g1_i1.p1  ORF type:complete len:327 (+),score=19.82 TRINITY_DN2338_c0_g1_i1:190-1170(+)